MWFHSVQSVWIYVRCFGSCCLLFGSFVFLSPFNWTKVCLSEAFNIVQPLLFATDDAEAGAIDLYAVLMNWDQRMRWWANRVHRTTEHTQSIRWIIYFTTTLAFRTTYFSRRLRFGLHNRLIALTIICSFVRIYNTINVMNSSSDEIRC